MTTLVGIVLVAMLLWPVIINAQPGSKFIYFGIDWKADNLDTVLFWSAIILMVISSAAQASETQRKEKLELKIAKMRDANYRTGI